VATVRNLQLRTDKCKTDTIIRPSKNEELKNKYILPIHINKNVNVRLFKILNLRLLFTDGFAILTQRCSRIHACFCIPIIYIDVKTCFYAFTSNRWRCGSKKKHVFTFTCHWCDIYIYKLRANLFNCAV
jgi:hypothetical protein